MTEMLPATDAGLSFGMRHQPTRRLASLRSVGKIPGQRRVPVELDGLIPTLRAELGDQRFELNLLQADRQWACLGAEHLQQPFDQGDEMPATATHCPQEGPRT